MLKSEDIHLDYLVIKCFFYDNETFYNAIVQTVENPTKIHPIFKSAHLRRECVSVGTRILRGIGASGIKFDFSQNQIAEELKDVCNSFYCSTPSPKVNLIYYKSSRYN